jgi:hypothetical protein
VFPHADVSSGTQTETVNPAFQAAISFIDNQPDLLVQGLGWIGCHGDEAFFDVRKATHKGESAERIAHLPFFQQFYLECVSGTRPCAANSRRRRNDAPYV